MIVKPIELVIPSSKIKYRKHWWQFWLKKKRKLRAKWTPESEEDLIAYQELCESHDKFVKTIDSSY